MKKYFAHLRPLERRLAVGVLVVLILVLNFVFIWPHFSDWGVLKTKLENARKTLAMRQETIAQAKNFEAPVKMMEGQGEFVSPEDQAINFMHVMQVQSAQSGVAIANYSHSMMYTNEFFMEQVQNIDVVATDAQLVDFLYKLGSGASMIRVRDLELQPDIQHQHLSAKIRLVASYQKTPRPPVNSKTATAKLK